MSQSAPAVIQGVPTLRHWCTRISQFTSVQLLVQITNALTGLLLVRWLAKEDYSWYVIAAAAIATLNTLSDSGVSIAVLSRAGKCWTSSSGLGRLIVSALQIRTSLLLAACLFAIPWSTYLLLKNGATPFVSGAISLAILTAVWIQGRTAILQVANRIHGRFVAVATGEFTGALARLILVAVGLFLGLKSIWIPVFAAIVGGFVLLQVTSRQVMTLFDQSALASPSERQQILTVVRQCSANTVFVCLQANIAIWILGFMGQSLQTADFGALGRFAILFNLIASVMANIGGPMAARQKSPRRLAQVSITAITIYVVFGTALTAVAYGFPQCFLWVLGDKYSHLRAEVPLMFIMMSVSGLSQTLWAFVISRGWVEHCWIQIPLTIGLQFFLAYWIPLGELNGIVLFSTLSTLPTIVVAATFLALGIRRMSHDTIGELINE